MKVDGNGVQPVGLLAPRHRDEPLRRPRAVGLAVFLRTELAGAVIQMPVFRLLFLAPVDLPLSLLTG